MTITNIEDVQIKRALKTAKSPSTRPTAGRRARPN